jgi:hypothetical protein
MNNTFIESFVVSVLVLAISNLDIIYTDKYYLYGVIALGCVAVITNRMSIKKC